MDLLTQSEKFPEVNFSISCSKGTYIRSVASDFGKRLNSGATLIKLRRESSGNFNILNAIDVNEFVTQIEQCQKTIEWLASSFNKRVRKKSRQDSLMVKVTKKRMGLAIHLLNFLHHE